MVDINFYRISKIVPPSSHNPSKIQRKGVGNRECFRGEKKRSVRNRGVSKTEMSESNGGCEILTSSTKS